MTERNRWTLVLASTDTDEVVNDWVLAASAGGDGVLKSMVGRPGPDKKGDGDVVWVLVLEPGAVPADIVTVARLLGSTAARACEQVRSNPIAGRVVERNGPCALRTLLIRVRPGTPTDDLAGLEASLTAMPDHIAAIGSWELSRVEPGVTRGDWTYLWEQEFDEPSRFRSYMGSPYHWTGVERWFDPEIPGYVVLDEAHYLTEISEAVISR